MSVLLLVGALAPVLGRSGGRRGLHLHFVARLHWRGLIPALGPSRLQTNLLRHDGSLRALDCATVLTVFYIDAVQSASSLTPASRALVVCLQIYLVIAIGFLRSLVEVSWSCAELAAR